MCIFNDILTSADTVEPNNGTITEQLGGRDVEKLSLLTVRSTLTISLYKNVFFVCLTTLLVTSVMTTDFTTRTLATWRGNHLCPLLLYFATSEFVSSERSHPIEQK